MSEEKKLEENPLQEVVNKVAITPEDVTGAAEFWKHFNVAMPPELEAAFKKFAQDPTYENQQEVKLQVTKAIGHTDHEAFKDDMFKEIVEECRNVTCDMSFDRVLENVLDTEEENKLKS
jgi:hypothetical protein